MIRQLRSMFLEVGVEQAGMADGELVGYVLVLLKALGEACKCEEAIERVIECMLACYIAETRVFLAQLPGEIALTLACLSKESLRKQQREEGGYAFGE